MKKSLRLIPILVLLVGCESIPVSTPPTPNPTPVHAQWREMHLPKFDQISISGDVSVSLKGEEQNKKSKAFKNIEHHQGIHAKVVKGVLHISNNPKIALLHSPGSADVKIEASNVKRIILSDHTQMQAHNLKVKHMTIMDNSSGDLVITGVIGLSELTHTGHGSVKIHWINSDQLEVNNLTGTVELAGDVKTLRVRADGNAITQLSGLRAADVWVNGKGRSWTEVNPLKTLYAYGAERGVVAYLQRPAELNVSTQGGAAVIQKP